MNAAAMLDPKLLLQAVSRQIPEDLRENVVIIGSIATAWAFQDVLGERPVATKDIDLLLRPSIDAVETAEHLGRRLLEAGWQVHYPEGIPAADEGTPDHELPALRLRPPSSGLPWFVELLAEAPADQQARRHWRRLRTPEGLFGLPSFRYMRVATHGAASTPFGIRVAHPANMALAHLLEHAQPDETPVSSLPGNTLRYVKDVGRAVALWWLATEQSTRSSEVWLERIRATLRDVLPGREPSMNQAAQAGLATLDGRLAEAHAIAVAGVLDAARTSPDAYRRAYAGLQSVLRGL